MTTDFGTWAKRLEAFLETGCAGQQYDSCVSSPCPYASQHGCQHPDYPRRNAAPLPEAH